MADRWDEKFKHYEKRYVKPVSNGDSIPNPITKEANKKHTSKLLPHERFLAEREKKNELMDTEEGGWLQNACDQLSRGNYATANLALESFQGNVGTAQEAWNATVEGATLEKKTSWVDVVGEVVPDAHPAVKVGVGLAGDVVLDPSNLIPASWLMKAGKLTQIPKLLKLAGDIPAINKKMDGLKTAFIPGHQLTKAKSLKPEFKFTDAYKHKRDLELQIGYFRKRILEETTERMDLFRKAAKSIGMEPRKASAMMTKLHQAGLSDDILPELKPFYDEIAEGFKDIYKAEKEAGLIKDSTFRANYFPGIYEKGRLIVKDGEEIIGRTDGYFSKMSWKGQMPFSQGKTWDTVDIAKKELKKLQDMGMSKDIIPVEDWFKGYGIRKFVSDSAVAWKGYIDEAVENFATPLSQHLGDANVVSIKNLMATGDMAGAEKLMGNIKLEKGFTFVTKTTDLHSPKMQKFALKEAQRSLHMSDEAESIHSLTNIFKHTGGSGLVEVSAKDAFRMGLDDVYMMPDEIAKSVKQTFAPFSGNETVRTFAKGFDASMSAWKSMATAMRVAFHPRNALSNGWQMYLGGVNPAVMPKRVAAAGRVMLDSKSFSVNGFTAKDINTMADRFGIRAHGFVGSDVSMSFQKEMNIATTRSKAGRAMGMGEQAGKIGTAAQVAAAPIKAWSKAGRVVGSGIEDNARIALMIDQVKKLDIHKASLGEMAKLRKAKEKLDAVRKSVTSTLPESHPMLRKLSTEVKELEATVNREKEFSKISDHVKKYLFDYTEVTDFEKSVMGRMLPFYKWGRKNIPLQVESLVTQPHKFARLADFHNDLWPETEKTPTEKAVIPGWMKDGGFKKTSMIDEKGNPVYCQIDMPIEDLSNMFQLNHYMGGVNPLLAMVLSTVNVKTWPEGGKISTPGRLTPAPIWAAMLPDKVQKLCGMEPIYDPRTGEPKLGMSPQWLHGLNTAFPMLRQWEVAYPDGLGNFHMKDGLKYKAMSDFTGIKFRPLDIQQAKEGEYWSRKEAIQNVKKAMKQRQRKMTAKEMADIMKETRGK